MRATDSPSTPEQHQDVSSGSNWLHAITPILRAVVGVPLCVLWVLLVSYAASIFQEFDVELPGLSVIVLKTALFCAQMWPLGILSVAAFVATDFTICLVLKSHRVRVLWEGLAWTTPAVVLLVTLVGVVLPLISLVQNLG